MKADTPKPRIVKYGMPEPDCDRMVPAHFQVMEERKAFSDANFARLVRNGPAIADRLRRLKTG